MSDNNRYNQVPMYDELLPDDKQQREPTHQIQHQQIHDTRQDNSKARAIQGYCTLAGGILIMMFNGCFFLWANISVYVLSFFYLYDKNINQNAIFYVDFILILLNCSGYQVGTYLLNKRGWHCKIVLTLGGLMSLGGIFIASFMTNFWAFVFFYGAFSGLGCGINYFVPMVCAWDYFPERKGMITGILVGAYGLGSFIWAQISTRIVNPNNEEAQDVGIKNLKYFDQSVAEKVPSMFRILVLIWTCQVGVSILLIARPPKKEQEDQAKRSDIQMDMSSSEFVDTVPNIDPDTGEINREYSLTTVKAAFKSLRFWQYVGMMFGANVFGTIFSYEYKPYGLANDLEDSFLTWAGSFSSVTQVIARFSIGFLYDYLGFRLLFFIIMGINVANSCVCYFAVAYPALYFICIQLNYFVIGGIFALFPAPAVKTFGGDVGVRVYALVLYSSVICSGFDTLLVQLLYDHIGLQGLIYIGTGFTIFCLIINLLFRERLDIEQLDQKGLIKWGPVKKEHKSSTNNEKGPNDLA